MTQKEKISADCNLVWGAANIGAVVGRSAGQVRYLHSIGAFSDDAVWKLSHKTLVGDERKLKSGECFKRLPSRASA